MANPCPQCGGKGTVPKRRYDADDFGFEDLVDPRCPCCAHAEQRYQEGLDAVDRWLEEDLEMLAHSNPADGKAVQTVSRLRRNLTSSIRMGQQASQEGEK